MWDRVKLLHEYHGDVPVEVRILKLTEEVGEVAEAFIGVRGLNSRKGVCRSAPAGEDLARETDPGTEVRLVQVLSSAVRTD